MHESFTSFADSRICSFYSLHSSLVSRKNLLRLHFVIGLLCDRQTVFRRESQVVRPRDARPLRILRYPFTVETLLSKREGKRIQRLFTRKRQLSSEEACEFCWHETTTVLFLFSQCICSVFSIASHVEYLLSKMCLQTRDLSFCVQMLHKTSFLSQKLFRKSISVVLFDFDMISLV